MAQPAKFLFDTVFERQPDGRIVAPRGYREADIDAARAEGRAEGYALGREDALVKAEQEAGAMLSAIAGKVTATMSSLETERARLSEDACVLARMVAAKLAATLLATRPTAEIEGLLGDALAQLPSAPHVVVRVNDAWLEAIRPRIDAIARAQGFAGKIIILGEAEIGDCDCRIEWADGGLCRDTRQLAAEVDRMIERHIGTPGRFAGSARTPQQAEPQGDL